MSSHNVAFQLFRAPVEMLDEGNAATISVDRSPALVQLTSAGAETRTLAAPTRAGAILFIGMKVDAGDITLTVTGGFNETGDTTFTFSDPGQFAAFISMEVATDTFRWRLFSHYATGNASPTEAGALDGLTASASDLNALDNQTVSVGPAAGFTGGTGTVVAQRLSQMGGLKKLEIVFDLTGLGSSTTDLDIIGQGASAAYLFQYKTSELGTLLTMTLECMETPATGVTDIDIYSATEATGKFDDAIAGLAETALLTSGGAWANGTAKSATVMPAANEYIYLTGGAGGTAGTYTAGKFLLTCIGV